MEGRIKTSQHGTVPKTLGRQVGVIPISGGTKLLRGNGDQIPVGGTDISPESYSSYQTNRPPSGPSSRTTSSRSQTSSASKVHKPASSSIRRVNSQNNVKPLSGIPPSNQKSPKYSARDKGALSSPSSSRSASSKKSPGSKKSPSASSIPTDVNLGADGGDDCGEQDIRFIDVPSQRSRSGSSKGHPGSAGRKQVENGKKPYKTIDPEEVLAQNMESDFSKIYEINLHACEITCIDNMEKFRKVKVLDLSCNFIEQIQNLELNKDLRELKLYDNRLRKIECLENLKDLSSLQLQHNRIKSIGKGLGSLKKLKTLRIDCNQLLKIETPELSQCVQLTSLDISYNMLDSLTALNYLPNLEEVNASGNRLRTVSDMSKCKRLSEIDLSGNRLTDMSGLRGLPKLNTLNVSNNQLTSLKSMGRLKSLQDLIASGNHINELSTVPTQLPALEVLELSNNEITDWDEFYYLEEIPTLVELFISGNPFCAQDGSMPHYFSAIQAVIPHLEIIDGAHIKKHISKGAPLMRPMSASSIVSLRQMDSQMRSADEQMKSLEQSLEQKFASLRSTCDSLPAEPPRLFSSSSSSSLYNDTPLSSRCSSRSRILEARKFAANLDTP
ncbi:hypothetical protein ACF0H5_001009 [Mactra antiquata]